MKVSQPPALTKQELKTLTASLVAGTWTRGPRVPQLERAIAKRLDVPPEWVIVTDSCTSALHLAQRFIGNERSRYFVPLLTYAATWAWPKGAGREVVFLDCDDAGQPFVENDKPGPDDVVTLVDLWGLPAVDTNFERVVLDAAHRVFAPEHTDKVDRGVAVCYSFGPVKELSAPEGGALVWRALNDKDFRADVMAYLVYGQRARQPLLCGGFAGFMREPTAAFVLRRMARLRIWKQRRQDILETYEHFLPDMLLTPHGKASGHIAVVALPEWVKRDKLRLYLRKTRRIETTVHYPVHASFADTDAYRLSTRLLTLPCHTGVKPAQAAKVARYVRNWIESAYFREFE